MSQSPTSVVDGAAETVSKDNWSNADTGGKSFSRTAGDESAIAGSSTSEQCGQRAGNGGCGGTAESTQTRVQHGCEIGAGSAEGVAPQRQTAQPTLSQTASRVETGLARPDTTS